MASVKPKLGSNAELIRTPSEPHGGCLLTLTFQGGEKVVSNYELMGPVEAAMEASVR